MPRIHTVEETIKDAIPLHELGTFLKAKGYIPESWEYFSLGFTQADKSSPLQFEAKMSGVKERE